MKHSLSVLVLLVICLNGCKVVVVAPSHVAVVSEDMTFMCLPGETCEIDVSDYDFDMSLYAVPKPGYRFLYWSGEEGHLCPRFYSTKCHLTTRGIDPANEKFRTLLLSEQVFYLKPVYMLDESAPVINWQGIEGG